MSETQFQPGGVPVPDLARVATDQQTITGSGTTDDPLVAQGGEIAVDVDGVTIIGDGTHAAPLEVRPAGLADRVAVLTDGVTAVGDGTTGSPITVITGGGGGAIVTDGVTLQGFGTALVPAAIKAVQHDGTLAGAGAAGDPLTTVAGATAIATSGAEIAGDGTTGNPLHVVPSALDGEVAVATDATLTGDGTTGNPLHVVSSLAQPVVTFAASAAMQANRTNEYTGAAQVVATLPLANSAPSGTPIGIKCSTSGGAKITIAPSGGDVVLGEKTLSLGGAVQLVSDGVSSWLALSYGFQRVGFVSIKTYGAVGDGITDDRAAIQAAIAAAGVFGAEVYFPPGTYLVGRSGANAWALTVNVSNITLRGAAKGTSRILLQAGQPATPVVTLLMSAVQNVTIRDLVIDGNWGNAATVVSNASNGAAIGAATLNVASTAGFPAAGSMTVVSSTGPQTVNYAGVTATSFTGCTSAGTGFVLAGNNVGYVDANTGINQTTQGDPQSHGIMVRGCTNCVIENCIVQQAYGDGIWIGASPTDFSAFSSKIRVLHTDVNMSARNGIAPAQVVNNLTFRDCVVTNSYQVGFDTEPIGTDQYARDILIDHCEINTWWNPGNPARSNNYALTIEGGGGVTQPSQSNYNRKTRVINSTIRGAVAIVDTYDAVLRDNRITIDWIGNSAPGINAFGAVDHLLISGNEIYVDTSFGAPGNPNACIFLNYYQSGTTNYQPQNANISKNRCSARNGANGIVVQGTGGHDFAGVYQPGFAGVATGVGANSLTLIGAGWTAHAYGGFTVRMGGCLSEVTDNTVDTLNLLQWTTPLGVPTNTPAAGPFEILAGGGVVDVIDNQIDCTDDGNGHGNYGIYFNAARAGSRVRIRENAIQNAQDDAIRADSSFRTTTLLEIIDNKSYDNQVVPTCTSTVNLIGSTNIQKLVLRGNSKGDGVASAVSGLSPQSWITPATIDYWYLRDGYPEELAGFQVPEGLAPASIGATYRRMSGGNNRTLWYKAFDEGLTTGWQPAGQAATPTWTIDSGSGIAIPQTNAEWAALIAAAGLTGIVPPPDGFWTMQEAAGPIIDQSGSGYDLAEVPGSAGLGYRQIVPGWASLGLTTSDNVNGGWINTDPTLPDLATGDICMISYAYQASVLNPVRQIMSIGTTVPGYVGGAAATRATSGANVVTAAGSQFGVVRPYGIASSTSGAYARGFDDINKLAPGLSGARTGKQLAIGGNVGIIAPSTCAHVYGWFWKSVPTDANLSKLLGTAGWDMGW